jgi:ABC-2 type transport system permease protein
MNLALLRKSLLESRWLLLSSMVFMFFVHWLRVFISSFFTSGRLESILALMPEVIEPLLPVSFEQISTGVGRIAIAYDDPIVLLLVTVWAISRGSDAVSGELNRGTMEMLLAQPVTRWGVLFSQGFVTVLGAAILAATALTGTSVGLATITLEHVISPRSFVPAAINLFSFTVFLAGLTTMISSGANLRSRTIGIAGGIFAVSMVVKIVARMVPDYSWLAYTTFFTPFEPQLLASDRELAWSFWAAEGSKTLLGGLGYDGILVGLGLLFYIAATVIFCRRDLPAPL